MPKPTNYLFWCGAMLIAVAVSLAAGFEKGLAHSKVIKETEFVEVPVYYPYQVVKKVPVKVFVRRHCPAWEPNAAQLNALELSLLGGPPSHTPRR